MKNKIIKRFTEIALPFSRGAMTVGTKEEKIFSLLKEKFPSISYLDNIGLYIPSKKETNKIFVSHIDLVRPFQIGFEVNEIFNIEENTIFGALDNTLPNAFVIEMMLSESIPDDVAFLFTEGEETGLTGMRYFMNTVYESFPNKEKIFFVNTDVTNDNFNYSTSIEFDYPDISISKEINALCPSLIGFSHNRFTDDTSAIVSKHRSAFSCCLPTKDYCHSYRSNTDINKFEGYYFVLKTLLTFDFSGYGLDLSSTLSNEML